jgi:hypothetical protein
MTSIYDALGPKTHALGDQARDEAAQAPGRMTEN